MYKKLANFVFWFHWVWIAILIGGGILRTLDGFQWVSSFHSVVLGVTGLSQILWLGCPLSALEGRLRAKYDPSKSYIGSFVCFCLRKWFGISVPPYVIACSIVIMLIVSIIFL